MKRSIYLILFALIFESCAQLQVEPDDDQVISTPTSQGLTIDFSKEVLQVVCRNDGTNTANFTTGTLKGQNVTFFNLKQGDNILKDGWRPSASDFDFAKDAYVLYSDGKKGNSSSSGTITLTGKTIKCTNIICFGDYEKTIKTTINNVNLTCP